MMHFIVSVIVGIIGLVFCVCSIIWSFHDAQARGKFGCLVAVAVLLTWPVGLILWLLFRPASKSGRL